MPELVLGDNKERRSEPVRQVLAVAPVNPEVSVRADADELAEFLLASWQGAILRMKVERSPAALERFKKIAFQTVFKELS